MVPTDVDTEQRQSTQAEREDGDLIGVGSGPYVGGVLRAAVTARPLRGSSAYA